VGGRTPAGATSGAAMLARAMRFGRAGVGFAGGDPARRWVGELDGRGWAGAVSVTEVEAGGLILAGFFSANTAISASKRAISLLRAWVRADRGSVWRRAKSFMRQGAGETLAFGQRDERNDQGQQSDRA